MLTVKNWDNIAFMDIVNLPHGWKGLCTAITRSGFTTILLLQKTHQNKYIFSLYSRNQLKKGDIINIDDIDPIKSKIDFPINDCMGFAISPLGTHIMNLKEFNIPVQYTVNYKIRSKNV